MPRQSASLIALLRPRQALKQAVVAAPALALGFDVSFHALVATVTAVLAFWGTASVVYTVNDLADIESDRQDAVRAQRPIASGSVSPRTALAFSSAFAVVALLLVFTVVRNPIPVILLCLGYLALNLAYSLRGWRQNATLGLAVVAAGFPIRFQVGLTALDMPTSWWALTLLAQLSLFMLAGKRFQRQTSVSGLEEHRHQEFWLLATVIFGAALTSAYAGFISAPTTQQHWGESFLLLSGVPLVLALLRYLQMLLDDKDGDGTERVVSDPTIILLVLIYALCMLTGRATA